ncbi:hypothetical protein AVEN_204419-1 [Araneus ventricosus]|uniref:Uncharacterized protein n=1 Tax=Araneus ventricosus TaxID=182803 RepID=A0A4Y2S0E8_ARAVE|nr:hypothetical protein AVEN_204419-1 [Araneus ventricosus]
MLHSINGVLTLLQTERHPLSPCLILLRQPGTGTWGGVLSEVGETGASLIQGQVYTRLIFHIPMVEEDLLLRKKSKSNRADTWHFWVKQSDATANDLTLLE